jgi:hypothetical protein
VIVYRLRIVIEQPVGSSSWKDISGFVADCTCKSSYFSELKHISYEFCNIK